MATYTQTSAASTSSGPRRSRTPPGSAATSPAASPPSRLSSAGVASSGVPTLRTLGKCPGAPHYTRREMGVLAKILRAGEGKKQRALRSLVPDINALEPAIERLSADELKARRPEFRKRRGRRQAA